jgi:O-antigen/teichoic acid export membrane protein
MVVAGALWTLGFRLIERSLSLVSTLILARLLTPEYFGLVAMSTAVVTMVELFTTLGFEQALIRDQQATRAQYDTAWTLNAALGLCAGLAIAGLANPIAAFFGESRLPPLLYILAFVPLLDGLTNVGIVDFRKHLKFHLDFRIQVIKKLAGVIATVALALVWRSAWALVLGTVIGRIVGLAMSYVMHPYRPGFSLSGGRGLLKFSLWVFLNNLLQFLRLQSANLVIGRVAGAQPLGMYTLAYDISNLPTTQIVTPLNRAVMPGFAKLANDRTRVQNAFLKVLAIVAVAAIPVGVGIACLAHLVVPLLLGQQWLGAVPAVRWLALFGVTMALQMNVQSLYNGIGKPHINALVNVGLVAVLVPMLVVMTRQSGIVGAAQAYVVTGMLVLPVNYVIATRTIQMPLWRVMREIWRPVLGSAAMALALAWFPPAAGPAGSSVSLLWSFAASVAFGATVYVLAVLCGWWLVGRPDGAEQYCIEGAAKLLRKARRPH